MINRFRTYDAAPAAVRKDGATAGLRLRAETANVFTGISAFILCIVFILVLPSSGAAVPPGTVISNTASVSYTDMASSVSVTSSSNSASVTTIVLRTTAAIELLQYGAGVPGAQLVSVGTTSFSTSGTTAGPFAALPVPTHITPGIGPAAIDLSSPVPLVPAMQSHVGEPVFIRLIDGDQNIDPAVRETVLITMRNPTTLDQEVLRLLETGPNTGIYVGYVQTGAGPAISGNGTLEVVSESSINASYIDSADATDAHAAGVLVDPFGIVFSSGSGLPLNGAAVTMINAATGAPATVYGEDGVSTFPATIISGGTATDSAGVVYTFGPGGFRFPFIAPGTYRLVVAPPTGFGAPSQVPTAVLQSLPGAPFAIVAPGSRGEDFIVNPGPALHIDVPVDPVGAGGLWLVKTAGKQTASAGDFIPYRLSVQNTSPGIIASVTVSDVLPLGFRYRKGSARLNNAATPEPAISADGRTLSFAVGALNAAATPGSSATIVYAAEVGAGARSGRAINTAVASNGAGSTSNQAQASVLVTEDLYRSTATIAGRIIVDGCGDKERSEVGGLAGVRIYREDGSFVVTDKNGMYHFEGVRPGSHVVQLDLATIPQKYEVLACEENTRFAGTAFSQFADLQGGTMWRADFHLGLKPKPVGEIGIELSTARKCSATRGPEPRVGRDFIEYTVPLHVGVVPARNIRVSIILPEGGSYREGSAALAGRRIDAAENGELASGPAGTTMQPMPIEEPQVMEGTVTFRFAELPANWEGLLTFDAEVPVDGPEGKQLTTAAVVTSDSPDGKNNRTPAVNTSLVVGTRKELRSVLDIVLHPQFSSGSADLTAKDKQALDRLIAQLREAGAEHITVTGHTDSLRINGKLRERYPDNYALSHERAASVGSYLAEALGLSPERVTYDGKGPDDPVASNTTRQGRARNRRVELRVRLPKQILMVPALISGPPSGMKAVATIGLRPGEEWPQEQPKKDAEPKAVLDVNVALETAQPGLAWLWPQEGNHPSIPSVKIAVQHDPARKLKLFLNNEEVNGVYFEGMTIRKDGKAGVSRWIGIHLVDGDNEFAAIEYDEQGVETGQIARTIHYSTPPVHVELVPQSSKLIADGRTIPSLAFRLSDKDGHPAREGMVGEYRVDPPHLARKRMDDLQKYPLTESASDRHQLRVDANGIAVIELEPTTQSGEAVVRIPLADGERKVRVWLKPEERDWILVGLAEGTYGYNVVTGNMESLLGAGEDEHYYDEGRVAFYAKGRVKGEWLLTMAYDSAKQTPDGRPGLYQTIDPNKYYLLYGDGTEQRYDAPSSKKIYLKLERDQFYALFGDFATGLNVTELSKYTRNLTGFKSEMKTEHFEYNVFLSETTQAFVKDEIRGDGTSGLYRLSRKNLVLNSDQVTIETRDRFKSEVIVSQQRLTRFLDYTIDYDSGTLWFKSPVYSRDDNFNPIFIVAEYEAFDASDKAYTYGGRAGVKLFGSKVAIGATHVHEGMTGGEGDLDGVDATVDLGATKFRAEVAATKTDQAGATRDGSAYLAELQHRSEKAEGKVYLREQDNGFGLGQQNGSETGTRKIGGDLTYRITTPWSVGAEVFRQETLSTGATRDLAEIRGRYALPKYDAQLGLRHAEDTLGTGQSLASDQIFAGGRYQFTDRLSGRVRHDQSLGSAASTDFPTRTTMGLDFKLNNTAALFAEQEFTRGAAEDTATSRVGVKASPWTGGQLGSTVEQQTTEYGARLFSTTGLKQSWQITKEWSADAGLDRSSTIRHTGNPSLNNNVPSASGSAEDFTAVTVGAGYRQERWSWTGRVESRTAESEDKFMVFTGANGEVSSGLALAAGLQTFRTDAASGVVRFSGDLRFGAAYRPLETRFIVLDRIDLLREEQKGGDFPHDNWRVINNFVMNAKPDLRSQFSFQYAAKYVKEAIDQNDYRSYTDLTGLEGRYDLTKTWDIGVRGLMLHSWSLDQKSYGAGASVGYSAAKNIWISLGYNSAGFTDRDFSKADFTAQGPFIKLRMKFDQVSVREAVRWITGQ